MEAMIERATTSVDEAATLTGVTRATIYNWMRAGKIEYVRTAGGAVRIYRDTLWREPNEAVRPKQAPRGAVARRGE